jgi:outer membrane protein
MKTPIKTILASYLIAVGISANAQAGEFSAGVAIIANNSPFIEEDTKTYLVPLIKYEGDNLDYFLDTATYTLVRHKSESFSWRIAAVGKLRFLDRDTEGQLAGMQDRDASLDIGVGFESQAPWGDLGFVVVGDATSAHKGAEAAATYSYEFSVTENFTLTPSLEISVYSKKLADYYYGVRASEATANRAEYHPDDSGQVKASIAADYRLTDRWTLISAISVSELDKELTNSPIVNDDLDVYVAIGTLYRFE